MNLEELKSSKIKLATAWSCKYGAEGILVLTVNNVGQLFGKSDSCIRKWCDEGKLERIKEDEKVPQSPVRITLESVLSRIDKISFV